MRNAQRFNFTEGFDGFGVPDALPQLPISLTYQDSSVEFSALLDTGASVNVLPYSLVAIVLKVKGNKENLLYPK
jgi:hypothetical protein